MPTNKFMVVHVSIGNTLHEFTVDVPDYELSRQLSPSELIRGRQYGREHILRNVLEQVLTEVLNAGGDVETLRTIQLGEVRGG